MICEVLTPSCGSFYPFAYFTRESRGDATHLGVPPQQSCGVQKDNGLAAGEDCRVSAECADGLRCLGVPHDGSVDIGKCVDTTPVRGEGEDCDRRTPCAEGTLCAGQTLWGEGNCVAQWMAGTFTSNLTLDIDAEPGQPLMTPVTVYGLASVPVDITVTVRIEHARGRDLVVELIDPNDDSAMLWNHSDEVGRGPVRSFALNGISRDDAANGRWLLSVEDTVAGVEGILIGWDLFVVSRWD